MSIPEISAIDLNSELASTNPPWLLDVREDDELEINRLDNIVHIPMGELADRLGELDRSADWVVICRTGNRSGRVTAYMLQQGFSSVRNMAGGMNAWAADVDSSMAQY